MKLASQLHPLALHLASESLVECNRATSRPSPSPAAPTANDSPRDTQCTLQEGPTHSGGSTFAPENKVLLAGRSGRH